MIGCLGTGFLPAQNGDRAGDPSVEVPLAKSLPKAPVVPAERAHTTLVLADGIAAELVASEPLIGDPVALAFDPDGRLWVLEMRGYMPDADGFGEDYATGRLVVLSDDDHDGRMDRSTVYVDDMVLPRAFAFVRGGVLVLEPPWLRRLYDDNHDLVPDREEIVAAGFGGLNNPEHAANGLIRGLDNWMQCINHPLRLRDQGERLELGDSPILGQWGGAYDQWGRLFHNSNSDVLRACVVPPRALARHRQWPLSKLANVQVVKSQAVRPARPTPGVNRGYQPGFLDDQARLRTATGACSPCIYRGQLFGSDYAGNAFVCEPAGHLVKRYRLTEVDGLPVGTDAYGEGEWLASTDERFRPVAITEGPDGALYIADFYRGLIQHRLFLTSYLRDQVDRRELAAPTGLGRIWRLVPRGQPIDRNSPGLSARTTTSLIGLLQHPSGFFRDSAQRLLVERRDRKAIPLLLEVALQHADPLARLHAFWTLEGLDALNREVLLEISKDVHPELRVAALRVGSPLRTCPLRTELERLCRDQAISVRRQVALGLADMFDPGEEHDLLPFVAALAHDRNLRDLLMTGLAGREASLIREQLIQASDPDPIDAPSGLLRDLARSIVLRKSEADLVALLSTAVQHAPSEADATALLEGLNAGRPLPDRSKFQMPWELSAPPEPLEAWMKRASAKEHELLTLLDRRLTWPGKPGYEQWAIPPLDARGQLLADKGQALFLTTCAGCHHPEALGIEGLGPPLFESPRIQGPSRALIGITLVGLRGKLQVKGRGYDSEMPSLRSLDDENLAAILTWLRRSHGNRAGPIFPEEVQALREELQNRSVPLDTSELESFGNSRD